MSENYTDCLFNDKIILESEQVFGSDYHDVYTVEIIKIALSSNDDKRLENLIGLQHGQMHLKCVKVKR